ADETTTNVEVDTPPANGDVNVAPTLVPAPAERRQVRDSEPGRIYRSSVSPHGGGLFVGGGFEDFTDNNLRSMTGVGGYWSARIVGECAESLALRPRTSGTPGTSTRSV